MRSWIVSSLVGFACLVAAPSAAQAQWKTYRCDHYGFSMLVPQGTKMKDAATKDGWAWLKGQYDGVEVWGLARLCKRYTPEEIEKFGVKRTKIARKHWKEIGRGKSTRLWGWYREVLASDGTTAFYGIYGTGPRGSYLLLLRTTVSDYEENKAAYQKWAKSLTLLPGWRMYHAKEYGFTMLVPDGAKLEEAEVGRWAGLIGKHKGVEVYGCAYKGKATEDEIVAFGVEATEIPGDRWKQIARGKNQQGWRWWKIAHATHAKRAVFAGYGVSKKRKMSYLLFVRSTAKDFKKNRRTYEAWARAIELD